MEPISFIPLPTMSVMDRLLASTYPFRRQPWGLLDHRVLRGIERPIFPPVANRQQRAGRIVPATEIHCRTSVRPACASRRRVDILYPVGFRE
jgi:hypothetical protein